jgi:hypothetical protein
VRCTSWRSRWPPSRVSPATSGLNDSKPEPIVFADHRGSAKARAVAIDARLYILWTSQSTDAMLAADRPVGSSPALGAQFRGDLRRPNQRYGNLETAGVPNQDRAEIGPKTR